MEKLIIGTNLKMYKGISETKTYLKELKLRVKDIIQEINLFVIPSYTSLPIATDIVKNTEILLGAQNMHSEDFGQFTGEVSPIMLKELGVDLVEIGHSERRRIFNENDEDENQKVISAINHGFISLLCIGETSYEKENKISNEKLAIQLKIGLKNIPKESFTKIWIAYEPVWAIGVHGVPADPNYIAEKHQVIKKILHDLCPICEIPILFGGSVNPLNATSIIELNDVDGLFIGRAAWDAREFDKLIRQVMSIWKMKS